MLRHEVPGSPSSSCPSAGRAVATKASTRPPTPSTSPPTTRSPSPPRRGGAGRVPGSWRCSLNHPREPRYRPPPGSGARSGPWSMQSGWNQNAHPMPYRHDYCGPARPAATSGQHRKGTWQRGQADPEDRSLALATEIRWPKVERETAGIVRRNRDAAPKRMNLPISIGMNIRDEHHRGPAHQADTWWCPLRVCHRQLCTCP